MAQRGSKARQRVAAVATAAHHPRRAEKRNTTLGWASTAVLGTLPAQASRLMLGVLAALLLGIPAQLNGSTTTSASNASARHASTAPPVRVPERSTARTPASSAPDPAPSNVVRGLQPTVRERADDSQPNTTEVPVAVATAPSLPVVPLIGVDEPIPPHPYSPGLGSRTFSSRAPPAAH